MNESMCVYENSRDMYGDLRAWFDSPLGCSLQAQEANRLRTVLPRLYGTVALQLGAIGRMDLMDASVAPARVLLDLLAPAHGPVVYGTPDELPFDGKSIDIALLPHTLDFASDPKQVLRETYRVLKPEGHVVIFGFNPLSLWGLRRLFTFGSRRAPWCGKFLRLARVKDWLSLLDLELTHGSMIYYRPPLKNDNARDRLFFLDKMGDRWWPMMAAVYLLVAKKRVVGVTPLPLNWKRKPAVGPTAEPAARGIIG